MSFYGVVEGLQGGLGVEAGGGGQARAGHRVIPSTQWREHRPRALKWTLMTVSGLKVAFLVVLSKEIRGRVDS